MHIKCKYVVAAYGGIIGPTTDSVEVMLLKVIKEASQYVIHLIFFRAQSTLVSFKLIVYFSSSLFKASLK